LAPLTPSGIISGMLISALRAVGATAAITAPFAVVFKKDLLEFVSSFFILLFIRLLFVSSDDLFSVAI
jgi:hypothetical protein